MSLEAELLKGLDQQVASIKKQEIIGKVIYKIAMSTVACVLAVDIINTTHETNNLVKQQHPTIITKNVIGNPTPDTFYMFNGQRAYVEIDGQPIENYIPKR